MNRYPKEGVIFSLCAAVLLVPVLAGFPLPPDVHAFGCGFLFIAGIVLARKEQFFAALRPYCFLLSPGVLCAAALLAGAVWCAVFAEKKAGLGYHTYDSGIYAQSIASFARRGVFFNSFSSRNEMGDHFAPNLALLAPFFRLSPSVLWLSAAKTAAYLASFLMLAAAARRAGWGQLLYLPALLLLLHPYIGNAVSFEFQPSSLALPFVLAMFFLAPKPNPVPAAAAALFAAGFKEHLALAWISAAIYLALEKKQRRRGAAVMAAAAAALLIINFLVLPALGGGHAALRPGVVGPLENLGGKMFLIAASYSSWALLPLLSPATAAAMLPSFGLALVSRIPEMQSFDYHYQDLPLICLAFASWTGFSAYIEKKSWLNKQPAAVQQSFFAAGMAAFLLCLQSSPAVHLQRSIPWPIERETAAEARLLDEKLPAESEVWAVQTITPFLIGRPKLRSIDRYSNIPRAKTLPEYRVCMERYYLVLTDDPVTSSLPEDFYLRLLERLESGSAAGRFKPLPGFSRLKVYESPQYP